MKRIFSIAAILFLFAQSSFSQESNMLTANNQKVKLSFSLDGSGIPHYAVSFDGLAVVKPSRLGFTLNSDVHLDSNFVIVKSNTKKVDET